MNGQKHRLLDDADVISAKSGGTVPSAYCNLRSERTFDEFEAKMLSRNFENELVCRNINPQLVPVSFRKFGKSDLFAELYDETVFDHAAKTRRARGLSISEIHSA